MKANKREDQQALQKGFSMLNPGDQDLSLINVAVLPTVHASGQVVAGRMRFSALMALRCASLCRQEWGTLTIFGQRVTDASMYAVEAELGDYSRAFRGSVNI